MKFNQMHSVYFFVSSLFLLSFLSAQDSESVQAKVNLVAWGPKISGLVLKNPSGDAVEALPFSYNKSISYSGPSLLAIYKVEVQEDKPVSDEVDDGEDGIQEEPLEASPSESEKSIDLEKVKNPYVKLLFERREEEPELVSLVPLPSNSKNVTILLAPAAQGTFQPHVIDDDPRKLPKGKLRVHNLTPFPIRVEEIRGQQRCELEPKKQFLFRPNKNNLFTYRISYKKGSKWQVEKSSQIWIRAEEQLQLVILKSEDQFFTSADGTRLGFLQFATLRRKVE